VLYSVLTRQPSSVACLYNQSATPTIDLERYRSTHPKMASIVGSLPGDSGICKRLYSLDALRGLASLVVVIYHYRHFFYTGAPLIPDNLPFWSFASEVYEDGADAVPFFFSLSGFVFYSTYAHRIANLSVSFRRFAFNRFSRLYPLHFFTLHIVALGQMAMWTKFGVFFIYPHNDAWHFILNLGLANHWGLQTGWSFNAPTWSVSVEILLYVIFFACTRFLPINPAVASIISWLGFFVVSKRDASIGNGIGHFFLGGCAYFTEHYLARLRTSTQKYLLLYTIILLWGLIVFRLSVPLAQFREGTIGAEVMSMIPRPWPGLKYPLVILTAVLMETHVFRIPFRIFARIGDISYSMYLIHFPLQLVFAFLVRVAVLEPEKEQAFFYRTWSLLLFISCLVMLSLASYQFFEMPTQNYLKHLSVAEISASVDPPQSNGETPSSFLLSSQSKKP
jgi:peptidoglycan/LPS O-acetylase OafA/YrhL